MSLFSFSAPSSSTSSSSSSSSSSFIIIIIIYLFIYLFIYFWVGGEVLMLYVSFCVFFLGRFGIVSLCVVGEFLRDLF